MDTTRDQDDWREVRRQIASLDGQRSLFEGETIKTRKDCGRKEFKDRRAGQQFLFDQETDQ